MIHEQIENRVSHWFPHQKLGDIFLQQVISVGGISYTAYFSAKYH